MWIFFPKIKKMKCLLVEPSFWNTTCLYCRCWKNPLTVIWRCNFCYHWFQCSDVNSHWYQQIRGVRLGINLTRLAPHWLRNTQILSHLKPTWSRLSPIWDFWDKTSSFDLTIDVCFSTNTSIRDVRPAHKSSQIGPKWDKSGIFKEWFSVHFGSLS